MSTNPRTLVILGASGDLAARLLLPGLGQLLSVDDDVHIELIGVGGTPITDEEWRERVTTSFTAGGATPSRVKRVLATTRFIHADATSADDLARVLAECSSPPALYFALPPAVTEAACAALATITLPHGTSLALEKPFGTDLRSARALNRRLATLVPEKQVHRVDHFLAKSTVLNLLGLRFANRLFEQSWNSTSIEKIEIHYEEDLGLESRAGYYDKAGALIDMIQSHLLLVLAIVAMEPPSTVDADDLRGAMAQALRATRVWGGDAAENSRRARYTGGTINGRKLPAYASEPGVDPERDTETLAEITFAIDNWRWAGVPFVLRSGKALSGKKKDIIVTFRAVPHLPTGMTGAAASTQLCISLDPDGMTLDLNINGEGDPFRLDQVTLGANFGAGRLSAYGEVLSGFLAGDPTLSVRGDAAEECWRIVSPVLKAWRAGEVPLDTYRAGSHGPTAWKKPTVR